MNYTAKLCDIFIIILFLVFSRECTNKTSINIKIKYQLASEAYNVARQLFNQSTTNYITLKEQALHAIDTFLDLVVILNDETAKEIRSAIVKFYKLKYFHDFTNYVIALEDVVHSIRMNGYPSYVELLDGGIISKNTKQCTITRTITMIDITEHCLISPVEKVDEIREQFHNVIKNFQDIRYFDTVEKCLNELPDEVAVAHCILHQAVLFNETVQASLTKIVEIKTRQHAQDINSTLYEVKNCFQDFVPDFYKQLLVDAYTESCGFLRIVNASASDLVNNKWRHTNETHFPKKWSPLVTLLKDKSKPGSRKSLGELIFLTRISANLTTENIVKILYP